MIRYPYENQFRMVEFWLMRYKPELLEEILSNNIVYGKIPEFLSSKGYKQSWDNLKEFNELLKELEK